MSRADRELRKQRRALELRARAQESMMMQAADVIDRQNANIRAVQERNDFWRNLLVGSAFDSVRGMERPVSELVREHAPMLMGERVNP